MISLKKAFAGGNLVSYENSFTEIAVVKAD